MSYMSILKISNNPYELLNHRIVDFIHHRTKKIPQNLFMLYICKFILCTHILECLEIKRKVGK